MEVGTRAMLDNGDTGEIVEIHGEMVLIRLDESCRTQLVGGLQFIEPCGEPRPPSGCDQYCFASVSSLADAPLVVG